MGRVQNATSFIVPAALMDYAQDAVQRLSYLYPNIEFTITGPQISLASNDNIDKMKMNEELRYALYRSKIRAECAEDRSALISAVFGQ